MNNEFADRITVVYFHELFLLSATRCSDIDARSPLLAEPLLEKVSIFHLFLCCIRASDRYVVIYRILKQIDSLEYHTDIVHKAAKRNVFYILPIYKDAAAPYIPESCQKRRYGRLSATRGAYKCGHFTGPHLKRNVFQYILLCISEADSVIFNRRHHSFPRTNTLQALDPFIL